MRLSPVGPGSESRPGRQFSFILMVVFWCFANSLLMNELFIHCTICMPRTEEANQKIREEQRQKILNAAQTIFAQKGRTATMTDIAAQAGISQGLAYRYFKSKEEIFSILLKQAWAEAGGGPAQRIGQIQGTPGQRLTLLITYILESIRQTPGMSQIMYNALEDENTPNDLKAMIQRNGKAIQDIMRQFIVEGQATGEIAMDDPDQLLVALLVLL